MLDLKTIYSVFQKAGKIDEYKQIVEALEKNLELQKDNQGLKDENKTLKDKLKIKGSINPRDNAYWVKKEDGSEDGPFCLRCYDKNKDLMRLPQGQYNFRTCPECKNVYIKSV